MRKLNILTEDYIQLEEIFGSAEDKTEQDLFNLRYRIDESLIEYYKSEKDSSDYLKLRYSPIFEELVNFKYWDSLSHLVSKINNNTKIPLTESIKYSYILRDGESTGNSVEDSISMFGDIREANIPEIDGTNYFVEYTTIGKNNALKKIIGLQESIINAMNSLRSTSVPEIRESLYQLANAYTLLKGE